MDLLIEPSLVSIFSAFSLFAPWNRLRFHSSYEQRMLIVAQFVSGIEINIIFGVNEYFYDFY